MVSSPLSWPAPTGWTGRRALGVAALLLGAVLLAYGPALRGGFLWDDDAHVTKPSLRPLAGLGRIWFEAGATQQYYPLTHSAFWLEHRLWGDRVLGYHLVNVAEHAAGAWLLWAVLVRLAFPAPVLAALLFALHPVAAESVAWISEQKNTLSADLYLAAAWVYLGFDATRRRPLYSAALGLFVLALFTKSVTATLPAALLVVFWWQRGRLGWRRDVRPLVPWLVLGVGSGLFTAWIERHFIGAVGADFSYSAVERLFLSGRVLVFYLGSLVWPAHLMFIYPRWDPHAASGSGAYLLAVAVLGAGLMVLARRHRGPLAGFLFFAGTLMPALGFVNVYPFRFSFVADHFQYLASLGILVPVAGGLASLAARARAGRRARAALGAALAAGLGLLTWRQAATYRSSEILYRATLAQNPDAWLIHYNLAVVLGMGPAHLEETIAEYRSTIRLKNDHWEAHNNLGSALLKEKGHEQEAIAEYRAAIEYNPEFAEAENNLGVALEEQPGGPAEAESHLRAAVRIRPSYAAAHSNLGSLLRRRPDGMPEAAAEYRRATQLAPEVPDYHYDLGNALSLLPGGMPEALTEYRTAIRLNPSFAEAHSNLGVALAHLPGQMDAALAEYRTALRLDPGSAEIHANLANALARRPADRAEALREYAAALQLDPADATTHYAYGILLAQDRGSLPAALAQFRQAAGGQPQLPEAHFALGVALAMTGDRAAARSELLRALELRPDFERARSALRHLEEGGR